MKEKGQRSGPQQTLAHLGAPRQSDNEQSHWCFWNFARLCLTGPSSCISTSRLFYHTILTLGPPFSFSNNKSSALPWSLNSVLPTACNLAFPSSSPSDFIWAPFSPQANCPIQPSPTLLSPPEGPTLFFHSSHISKFIEVENFLVCFLKILLLIS